MLTENEILVVTTTVASRADAERLARALMERRLAACVQVEEGLASFYTWHGEACEDAELRLTIKTLPACEAPLQAFFAQAHPYELPQFLATRMRASATYFEWVRAAVTPAAPAQTPAR
jgi:periplasmic divalent cation tolerance protein